jgi:hypothetical protein
VLLTRLAEVAEAVVRMQGGFQPLHDELILASGYKFHNHDDDIGWLIAGEEGGYGGR